MPFNSFAFIFVYLPIVAGGFYLLRRQGWRGPSEIWLIAASLAFYFLQPQSNLPVLIASLFFNWITGRLLASMPAESAGARRAMLFGAIAANVLFLAWFKYFDVLPLGLSFFTLTQIMYLVDSYERLVPPNTLREHSILVSFFPTVSLGPLVRAQLLLSQFRDPATKAHAVDIAPALLLFAVGLFKKIVIAESFSRIADAGYASPHALSLVESWVTSISFSLQLYYDFSGYSDMAMAAALFLGIKIPANFNSPYKARSIVEFWQRWHLSLSNFITTYIYTPMIRALKRPSFEMAMAATLVTMLIAGIWHGSSLNYAIFGLLHGIGLVANQYWKRLKRPLPRPLAIALAFAYVNLTFVFFRAATIPDALGVLGSMAGTSGAVSLATLQSQIASSDLVELLPPALLGVALLFAPRNSTQIASGFTPTARNLALAVATAFVALIYLNSGVARSFVYNDF